MIAEPASRCVELLHLAFHNILFLFFHVFVFIDQWTEYTPYICGSRNEIQRGLTEQECKQLCSACVAIEYWSGGNTACYECFDKTQRYHYPNTNDGSYPPHVFVKN